MDDEKCFAKTERGCYALTENNCDKCNFFKTKTQFQKDADAANEYNRKHGILTPKEKKMRK